MKTNDEPIAVTDRLPGPEDVDPDGNVLFWWGEAAWPCVGYYLPAAAPRLPHDQYRLPPEAGYGGQWPHQQAGRWFCADEKPRPDVTHWMRLPPAPEIE